MVRTAVATVTGAILLAGVAATTGVVVGSSTAEDPVPTYPEQWPFSNAVICAPLNSPNFDYDPCQMVASYFANGFGINLQKVPYFNKWKAANPGEWDRILVYMADDTPWTSLEPVPALTKTYFGAAIRDAITMCKTARCGAMPLPVVPTTVTPNDTQAPTPPIVDTP